MLGLSHTTIYRALKKGEVEVGAELVQLVQGCKLVTEAGLDYLRSEYGEFDESQRQNSRYQEENSAALSALIEQLKEKDMQIAEKDQQIAEKDMQIGQLIEQSRNYQVLLKSEQEKLLLVAEKKPRILARLFGRKSS